MRFPQQPTTQAAGEKRTNAPKIRIPVTNPDCVTVRTIDGSAPFGQIGKDSIVITMQQKLDEKYKGKLEFGVVDVENILGIFAETYDESFKTGQAVLNAEGSDVVSVSVYNPLSNLKIMATASIEGRKDVSIQREITVRKDELRAEGLSEDEIGVDPVVLEMLAAYEDSAVPVDNTGRASVRAKTINIEADGSTGYDRKKATRVTAKK